MLKSFLYLNEAALSDYVSALEGGVRSAVGDRHTNRRGKQGKAGVGGLGVSGDTARETEHTVSMTDTPPAQFERLLRLAAADPETAGWVEVMDPDSEFPTLMVGALIDVECDIHIPAFVSMLNRGSGLLDTMKSISALADYIPAAATIDPDQLALVETMTSILGDKLMIIGTPDSDEWSITGQLLSTHQRVAMEDLEGDVRVVGKVKKKIGPGEPHSLLALPGSNIMSREKRRELARKGPSSPSDDSWVRGPALVIEILAIYR